MLFLTTLQLTLRLHALVPSLTVEEAYRHASAARAASTQHLRPELLLAIAWVESRYDPTATSRIERGVRVTGRYASTNPPAALDRRFPLYCGPLQTFATTWSGCLAMRDLETGYTAGVREIEQWLRDIRVRGDIVRALSGHACGNLGLVSGQCSNYPARVHWIEERLLEPRR